MASLEYVMAGWLGIEEVDYCLVGGGLRLRMLSPSAIASSGRGIFLRRHKIYQCGTVRRIRYTLK